MQRQALIRSAPFSLLIFGLIFSSFLVKNEKNQAETGSEANLACRSHFGGLWEHFGLHFGVLEAILVSLEEAWGRIWVQFWPCKMEANFGTKIGASPAKPRRDARWPSRAFRRAKARSSTPSPPQGG